MRKHYTDYDRFLMTHSETKKEKESKQCFKFYYHIDTIEKWYSLELRRWTHKTVHGPVQEKIKWAVDIVDAVKQLESDIGKIDHEYRISAAEGFEKIQIARRDRGAFKTRDFETIIRTEEISARQYARRCNHEW